MYKIRKLALEDYYLGYLEMLSLLSPMIIGSYEDFEKQFKKIGQTNNIEIFVIECNGKLVANGTIIIEDKFIHNNGKVGHIEDIVVGNDFRGKGYGQIIVNYLIQRAKEHGCYKIILDCKDDLYSFYHKMGFYQSGIQLRKETQLE